MRICKHIRCIMETMFSRRRHMFICMKKQMGCRKRKFMISPDFMVLRNLYLYRYSLLWRLCSFGFFVILNLIAGLMKKFLALYFVLIGSMVISGLMGDTIPCLSISILTIILICFANLRKWDTDTLNGFWICYWTTYIIGLCNLIVCLLESMIK